MNLGNAYPKGVHPSECGGLSLCVGLGRWKNPQVALGLSPCLNLGISFAWITIQLVGRDFDRTYGLESGGRMMFQQELISLCQSIETRNRNLIEKGHDRAVRVLEGRPLNLVKVGAPPRDSA